MPEGPSESHTPDEGAININSTYDLEAWAAKLRIPVHLLRRLILRCGPRVEDIRQQIKRLGLLDESP